MARRPTSVDVKPAENLGPLAMIFRAAARYPAMIVLAGLALLVTASATLAIPAYFRGVIDSGFAAGADAAEINTWFRRLFMVAMVLALGTACRFYFVSMLGERVVADIRLAVQQNLLRMSPGFFEENSPSEISTRMTADTAQIENVVGTTMSVALRNAITAVGGLAYMVYLAPTLALLMVVAIPLVIAPIAIFGRRVRKASRESQDRIATVGSRVTEVLGAMKIVQAFNQEGREQQRFATSVEDTFQAARTRILIRAILTATAIALIFGALTMIMWRGAMLVADGTLTGGTIAAFVFTGLIAAGSFGSLTEVYGDLLRGAGSASRLSELLAEKPAIAPPARPVALPVPPRGSLAFQNVSFSYPTRPEATAILGFTLTVEPGETVAIVGPSGAGKSTIFQLAERFYDPQGGTVKLDGVPLTQADPAQVRQRMALVPQEGVLFAADARDNLRYGAWDASDEEIWDAARAANAEKFLRELPQGLDTFLGEGGARLSGGQRQRVAIARAILRDAPILLLDEATSALDAESERLVQEALERLMDNRTTVVIAHRLATVRKANRIVVMDEGRIVEEGDHAALVAKGGLYARLAALQFDSAKLAS
ncbi:MAG: ABC transporter transmembrane domain-containing protein [Alteraurantiacibacter sp.]